uniref:Uncharacterized protein n=1 Tax=Oryza glumipatula TaxID=40148 RepID=A0A0D9ZX11_9ORYZ
MVSVLPKNLAFTISVPSPESFHASSCYRKAEDATYAVVSRMLGFSTVPRRLRATDVAMAPHRRRQQGGSAHPGVSVWAEDLRLEETGGLSPLTRRRGWPLLPLLPPDATSTKLGIQLLSDPNCTVLYSLEVMKIFWYWT